MKFKALTIGLLTFVLAAVALGAQSVHGALGDDKTAVLALLQAVEDAPDPDAAYLGLTPEQRAAIDEALSTQTVEIVTNIDSTGDVSQALYSSGCGTQTKIAIGTGWFDILLWKFNSRTKWCWNGTVHTIVPHFTTGGSVYAEYWSYAGTIYTQESGGLNYWYHHDSA